MHFEVPLHKKFPLIAFGVMLTINLVLGMPRPLCGTVKSFYTPPPTQDAIASYTCTCTTVITLCWSETRFWSWTMRTVTFLWDWLAVWVIWHNDIDSLSVITIYHNYHYTLVIATWSHHTTCIAKTLAFMEVTRSTSMFKVIHAVQSHAPSLAASVPFPQLVGQDLCHCIAI